MLSELQRWLSPSTFYVVASLSFVVMVTGQLVAGKKNITDLLGPVGRRLRRRHEQRDMLNREARRREVKEALQHDDTPDYQAMVRRQDAMYTLIKTLEAEITKLRIVEETSSERWDMTAAYLREDAAYHVHESVARAEQNINLELPEHRSYSQFCQQWRKARGLEYGQRWDDRDPPNNPTA